MLINILQKTDSNDKAVCEKQNIHSSEKTKQEKRRSSRNRKLSRSLCFFLMRSSTGNPPMKRTLTRSTIRILSGTIETKLLNCQHDLLPRLNYKEDSTAECRDALRTASKRDMSMLVPSLLHQQRRATPDISSNLM